MRTVGTFALALAGLGQAAPGAALEHDVVSLVARSGPVAKAVLVLLVLFSVVSWAITLFKFIEFRRARAHSASFLDVFRKSSKFSEVQAVCRTLTSSPLVGLFTAGYAELTAQMRPAASGATDGTRPGTQAQRPTLRSLDGIDRALLRAAAVEVNRLERRVTFLATTASITPFIGLFGTVWGIMTAFQAIGATGASNLAVVAPGIAEALIATAMGLFAAIPAVIAYNRYATELDRIVNRYHNFLEEFSSVLQRQARA